LTLGLLGLLAVSVLAQSALLSNSILVALLLALLAVNLVAALSLNPRLRGNGPLLALHLSLLLLLILLLGARLTYFDGQASVTVGAEFDGRVFGVAAGPLHRFRPEFPRFFNESLEEEGGSGRYVAAINRLRWVGADGVARRYDLTEGEPLLLNGYRVHLTTSRGLAPLFSWTTATGAANLGSVQLPDPGATGSFKSPRRRSGSLPPEFAEAEEWALPNGRMVWGMLERIGAVEHFRPANGEDLPHRLVLYIDGQRWSIRPGQEIELPDGRLTYLRLDSWVGYRIVYDVFSTWILAACVLAIFCMAWYYWGKFGRVGKALPSAT
jgi:cytochrome c biogenesis protein